MIRYIKGRVEYMNPQFVILENQGLGYRVYTSSNTLSKLKLDTDVMLHTHQHVREDQLTLFGFESTEELDLFELLIGISKIGPKVGLSVLSFMRPKEVRAAVLSNDKKTFSKVPGIGAKTAERMILELKDKLKDFDLWEYEDVIELESDQKVLREAVEALEALGYSSVEAETVCKGIKAETVENMIKKALKELN